MAQLFRIRRKGNPDLVYAFIKADSEDDALERFSSVAENDDYRRFEARETTIDFLTGTHPVIERK